MALIGLVMTGCAAALPPAVQIQDLKSIAGKWRGSIASPSGSPEYTIVIKESGSWEATTSERFLGFTRFEGDMFVRRGKILAISRTTGRTITYTLHEGEGRRVLYGQNEAGTVTIRLTPVD